MLNIMAMLINVAMVRLRYLLYMSSANPNRHIEYERLVADFLRRAGLHVEPSSGPGDLGIDIRARLGRKNYIFEIKSSSEARRDRAIPLIAQAILEAQSAASKIPGAIPVAVLAGERISESLAEQIVGFGMRNAPNVAVGVVDAEGFSHFSGFGLDSLNARASSPKSVEAVERREPVNPFSDLNQWMLKILLSEGIPESLLAAPRGPFANASQLAAAAGVSVMSAFRFARQLSEEGFLEQGRALRLVRIEDLLERWQASRRRAREIPLRWILREKNKSLADALRSFKERQDVPNKNRGKRQLPRGSSRFCLALYAAAEELGLKFVHGAQAHFYLERFDQGLLHEIGLSVENAGHQADVFVRIPESPEAVFRAAVEHDGVPVADVLQIWLDASIHPARGKAQADIIRREILSGLYNKGRG